MNNRLTTVLSAIAIVLGSGLVAAALYVSNTEAIAEGTITIERADAADRNVYGSMRAPIKIVEFSDYQCPYCSRVHPTIKELVDTSEGGVSWEYRHLPLTSHPVAKPAAIVAECVARTAGKQAFWEYTNTLFANQPQITTAYITEVAQGLGVSESVLSACQEDESIKALVAADMQAASTLGARGTPYSIIIYPDGSYKPIFGAVPIEQWEAALAAYAE